MTVLRALAATWLLVHGLVLRRVLDAARLQLLVELRPELAVGALVLESLPAVVGLAFMLRLLRPDTLPRGGPFAAASRWAALLALAGLVFLPWHAATTQEAARELYLRAGAFLGLLFLLDGPLEPRSARSGR